MAVVSMSNCDWISFDALSLAALDVGLGFKPAPLLVKRSIASRLYFELKEKGLGEAWTSDVADAWTAAYGTLSGYMISEAYGKTQAAGSIQAAE